MDEFRIESVVPKDPALDDVERLITEMYEYMQHHGLAVPLASNGTLKLRQAMERSLGHTGMLFVARGPDGVGGFCHGMLRLLPDYLGGGVVGLVNHTYVTRALRKHGLGTRLVSALHEWFISKNVSSIELQVLSGNADAIRFWQARGFTAELLQMRKFLRARSP
jgi:GNAT superfamily N-acetyltransferase